MSDLERLDANLLSEARNLPLQQMTRTDTDGIRPVTIAPSFRKLSPAQTFKSYDLKRTPQMDRALRQCQDVVSGEAWCAVLAGDFGVGKTHLANSACLERQPSIMWKVPDFLAFLRSRIDWGDLEQIVDEYGSPGFLLALDDLGTENRTDWAAEQLYRILDARYEAKAPTIITTNVGMQRLDGRLISRYRTGLVLCEGEDQRDRD